jgi:hypothetical protein
MKTSGLFPAHPNSLHPNPYKFLKPVGMQAGFLKYTLCMVFGGRVALSIFAA